MKRITSTDLANWGPTRDCQENLPLLVRRLIRASAVPVIKMLIPSGDNVILPGYDGIVETAEGTEYIPAGTSVWEIGTGKEFKVKAAADLAARRNDTKAAEITFVFVTPYVWPDKQEWIAKKAGEPWKKINIVDGTVLEEWIEQLPAVGYWLSKYLKLPLGNVIPLDQFWQEWSNNIRYTISSTLVVSGREKEADALSDFLLGGPGMITIKGPTAQEAVAFTGAVVQRMEEDPRESVFSKAVIADNENDLRILSVWGNPAILIANFESKGAVDQAVKNGHKVILPVGNDVTAAKADITLPRIRKNGFEKALVEMKFSEDESEKLTRDSGQSLSVLRRLLDFERNRQPGWAKDGNHSLIIPALLAGSWDEGKEDDKLLIGLLAGEPYDKYIAKLNRWKLEKDAPVFQVRSIWRMTSFLDAWSILAPYVTKADMENFKAVFLSAVPEINPALSLEADKRYLASFYGKSPKFSYALKDGLCQSLVLIAVFGEEFGLNAVDSPQGFADHLVHLLLNDADGDKWCTLQRQLVLLAEASPVSFLSTVENSLLTEDPPVMKMFGDMHSLFNSTGYHTGLLCALENLMFPAEYLLRTTLVLGTLSRLDPGGKLNNRPINTLRDTFIPWFNQTDADFKIRKDVLAKLAQKDPAVAWKLFLAISPQDHASVSPINRCKWRFDTQHIERTVTYEQVWDFQTFIFEKLIALAGNDEERTARLVDFYPAVNIEERENLLGFLTGSRAENPHPKNLVWNRLRKLLSQHREFSSTNWSLPEEELNKLDDLFIKYTPAFLQDRYLYLFEENWGYFPEGLKRSELSHEEREKIVDEKRLAALQEIYQKDGVSGIVQMIPQVSNTFQLARTATRLGLNKEEQINIFKFLNKDQTDKCSLFLQNYISVKTFSGDEVWVKDAWKQIAAMHHSEEALSYFFHYLPQRKSVWDLLETTGKNIQEFYWKNLNAHCYQETLGEKLYAIERLTAVNRHATIIYHVAGITEEIDSATLTSVLNNAATIPSSDKIKLDAYHVCNIFETLYARDDVPAETLTKLEWQYLSFLADRYSTIKPKSLLTELTANPAFFVEVVGIVYLPDVGAEESYLNESPGKYLHANGARNLLDSWNTIPGVSDVGSIDTEKLSGWISRARSIAKETKMVYGVDTQIGNMLANYPRVNKVDWPPREICEIIDEIHNDTILSSFKTKIFNSRGVSSRHPYEGGNQERALAAWFESMGKKISSIYPFTASALLDLAEGYKRDAKEEDDRARLDELR